MNCKPKLRGKKPLPPNTFLEDLLLDFDKNHRGRNFETKAAYLGFTTDELALRSAATLRVLTNSGKTWKQHPHFHRFWFYTGHFKRALAQASRRIVKNKDHLETFLAVPDKFAEIHSEIEKLLSNIPGLGKLAIYDITELIGYRWEFEPKNIYLHAGTRDGAIQLFGKSNATGNLLPASSTKEFLKFMRGLKTAPLSISEIEDFLCIYSTDLAALRSKRKLPQWSYQ